MILSRRLFMLGAFALPGCTTLDLLNQSGDLRDVYELQPITLPAQTGRSSRSLLVLLPSAPAAITTDRILIKQDPLAVTYLPDASWSDSLPQMIQSVLIRSLASARRIGFIGARGSGPIPDTVLLTRIDAFEVTVQGEGRFEARTSIEMTVLRDRDQRVLGTQRFGGSRILSSDRNDIIVQSFQQLLDELLPQAATWVLDRAA